ncbi:MAG: hypothetical protein R8P61_09115 [Bacteroidia bacterium]|nr:hypothetical protein [Bacteroidia bacterium]
MNAFIKYSFLLFLCILLSACIEEVDREFDFKEKTFIIGYIGTQLEPVSVKILQSVPIDSEGEDYKLVPSAEVFVLEEGPDQQISIDTLAYDQEKEAFLGIDPFVAQENHSYWLEVDLGEGRLKSSSLLSLDPEPRLKIEVDSVELDNSLYLGLRIADAKAYNYVIGMHDKDQGVDFFKAINFAEFHDKKLRTSAELLLYFQKRIGANEGLYILQLPEEASGFFREWNQLYEGLITNNLFTVFFSVAPENLSSGFRDPNGDIAEDVMGIFFPCNSWKFN